VTRPQDRNLPGFNRAMMMAMVTIRNERRVPSLFHPFQFNAPETQSTAGKMPQTRPSSIKKLVDNPPVDPQGSGGLQSREIPVSERSSTGVTGG
jgi:hypothetical protein